VEVMYWRKCWDIQEVIMEEIGDENFDGSWINDTLVTKENLKNIIQNVKKADDDIRWIEETQEVLTKLLESLRGDEELVYNFNW